jgi:hypothetical protein
MPVSIFVHDVWTAGQHHIQHSEKISIRVVSRPKIVTVSAHLQDYEHGTRSFSSHLQGNEAS